MGLDVEKWLRQLKKRNKPDEHDVKKLLKKYNLRVPEGIIVDVDEELDLNGLKGPFVAKVCSADIVHKTDQGGIILNINENDIADAVKSLQRKFREARVLVEQLVRYSGTEFIIGSMVDPVFGPTIMAGAGGILTEIYGDVSFRLAPCTAETAKEMLDELEIAPILNGFRGISLDKKELAEIISKVSYLFEEIGQQFSQMDINPIVYARDKWIILDARLI